MLIDNFEVTLNIPHITLPIIKSVEEQKAYIQDLEAMKELNEELEENHVEAEKELQQEIDQRDSYIRELHQAIEASTEAAAEYEHTVMQFRQLVRTLQSDIARLREDAREAGKEENVGRTRNAICCKVDAYPHIARVRPQSLPFSPANPRKCST